MLITGKRQQAHSLKHGWRRYMNNLHMIHVQNIIADLKTTSELYD